MFTGSSLPSVVNHDGNHGTAPDPLVRSAGALPRGVGWCMLFGIVPCCLGHRLLGFLNGLMFLHLLLVLRILLIGHTLGLLV